MQAQSKTQTLVQTALVAALLAVLSPFVIPIGPIPFSLGLLGVFFAGAILRPLPAVSALAAYILLGLVGLPVFSGFRGGPSVLVGPTGGYILGYFVVVLATSLGVKYCRRLPGQLTCALAGHAVCYLLGTLWYAFITKASFASGLAVCVLPFILPDIIKAVAALALAHALKRRLWRARQ